MSVTALLEANITARHPFLDFVYSRSNTDCTTQYLQVSGEPIFDSSSRFIDYRSVGMDVTHRMRAGQTSTCARPLSRLSGVYGKCKIQ